MNSDKDPLVSIILPVYNGEKYLSESLLSCINQTYKNIEVIIVNDCSTDLSLTIAEKFAAADARIKIFNNTVNKRLPATLNIGHEKALGKWISWTSDDNFYHPDAIATLLAALQSSDASVALSGYTMIEEDGTIRREVHPANDTHITLGNSVGASFLYTKEVFSRNDGYKEDLHTVEDYDFWLRASLHSRFIYLPQVLYSYRIHNESLTSKIEEGSTPFDLNLIKCYTTFLEQVDQPKLIDYFYKLHRNKEINVFQFLNLIQPLEQIIAARVAVNYDSNFKDFSTALDLKLRVQLLSFKSNQNVKTLIKALSRRPRLLYGYERKRSINYFIKCIS